MPEVMQGSKRAWQGEGIDSDLRLTADQYKAVLNRHEKESKNKAHIREFMNRATKEGGGEFADWEYQMKGPESLCREVAAELKTHTLAQVEDVLNDIKDIHSFTVVGTSDRLADAANHYRAFFLRDHAMAKIESENNITYPGRPTESPPLMALFQRIRRGIKALLQGPRKDDPPNLASSSELVNSQEAKRFRPSLQQVFDDRSETFSFKQGRSEFSFKMQYHTPESWARKELQHDISEVQRRLPLEKRHLQEPVRYLLAEHYQKNRSIDKINESGPRNTLRQALSQQDLYEAAKLIKEHAGHRVQVPTLGAEASRSLSSNSRNTVRPPDNTHTLVARLTDPGDNFTILPDSAQESHPQTSSPNSPDPKNTDATGLLTGLFNDPLPRSQNTAQQTREAQQMAMLNPAALYFESQAPEPSPGSVRRQASNGEGASNTPLVSSSSSSSSRKIR